VGEGPTGQLAEGLLVLPEERPMGLGDPLLKPRRVAHRESSEEARDIEGDCSSWVLPDGLVESVHVAVYRLGEDQLGTVGLQKASQPVAQVLDGLPERGASLGFTRLAPKQARQLLPGV
jgi:hypothetical protein